MLKKGFKILLRVLLGFVIISFVSTLIFRFVPIPFTPLMIIRYFEMEEGKIDKDWKSLDEIGKNMPLAVVTAEDQKFAEHFGFDMEAIEKAMKYNEKHKK